MKLNNLLLTVCAIGVLACQPALAKQLKIGMAVDDLRLERWQKDRDIFVSKAELLTAGSGLVAAPAP